MGKNRNLMVMQRAAAVSALGLLFACSQSGVKSSSKMQYSSFFENKWNYSLPSNEGRTLAADDQDFIRVGSEFDFYNELEIPGETTVYRAIPGIKAKVVVEKKAGLQCYVNGASGDKDASEQGDELVMTPEDGEEAHCLNSGENNHVVARVEVYISKQSLSWDQVAKNHDLMVKMIEQINQGKYTSETVLQAVQMGVASASDFELNGTTLGVSVGEAKAGDYFEIGPVTGKIGLTRRALKKSPMDAQGNEKLRGRRAFSEEPMYAVACQLFSEQVIGRMVFSATIQSRWGHSDIDGKVNCYINKPGSEAVADVDKRPRGVRRVFGSFSIHVLRINKAQALAALEGLLKKQEDARAKAEQEIDSKNSSQVSMVVNKYRQENVLLKEPFKEVVLRKQIAAEYERKIEEREEELKKARAREAAKADENQEAAKQATAEVKRLAALKAQEEAVRSQAIKQAEEEGDKYFFRYLDLVFYRRYYTFRLDPQKAVSDGRKYVDYRVDNGSAIYTPEKEGSTYVRSENLFYPVTYLPSKDPASRTKFGDGVKYLVCAGDLPELQQVAKEIASSQSYLTGQEIINKLNSFNVKESGLCARSSAYPTYVKFVRMPEYRFCFNTKPVSGRIGRDDVNFIRYVPTWVDISYAADGVDEPVKRRVTSQPMVYAGGSLPHGYGSRQLPTREVHPFFKRVIDSKHVFNSSTPAQRCLTSPNAVLSSDDDIVLKLLK